MRKNQGEENHQRQWWRRVIRPSTIAFAKEGRRTPNYSWFDFIHGYIYGRWPYLYIGLGTGEHRFSKVLAKFSRLLERAITRKKSGETRGNIGFADTYHGKAVPLETARQLVTVHENIRIPDLEKIIPYARARSLVLQNPESIVVLDCPCRAARSNPCLPLDVCLIIGEPFASFVREHHPTRTRRISSNEAVEILKAEDERGHVHHAFFKDAMLQRFYAICNCCSCCCGAMQAQRNGVPMLASSGYVCRVDPERCIGCGDCYEYCQFEALTLEDGQSIVKFEQCMGCGVCTSKCKQGALSLESCPEKGVPLEMAKLSML